MLRISVFASQPYYRGSMPQDARCYRCGTSWGIERHHILNGPLRDLSEKEGLWVYLCHSCHQGPKGIHANKRMSARDGKRYVTFDLTDAEHLKWHAQLAWESRYVRDHDTSWTAARSAWHRLTKVPLQSYDYVQDDNHGLWSVLWTR